MPVLTKLFWKLNHAWKSGDYEKWTEKMMIDELKDLFKFYKREKITYSFKELIEEIDRRGGIEWRNKIVDFHKLQEVIGSWKHMTTTCTHYIREWLAQDESRLKCEFNIPCNHFNVNCEKYEPMLKARSIEKIIEDEIEWSVS